MPISIRASEEVEKIKCTTWYTYFVFIAHNRGNTRSKGVIVPRLVAKVKNRALACSLKD